MQQSLFTTKLSGPRTSQIATALQKQMMLYGYKTLETPIIEDMDWAFNHAESRAKQQALAFDWQDHHLVLRSDFTAAAAISYLEQKRQDTVRWQFSGPVFQVDPQNPNLVHQHFSVGAELIAMSGPSAEAEVIGMATQSLATQNIDNWTLVIGHPGLTQQLLTQFNLSEQTQRFILDHRWLLKDTLQGKKQLRQRLDQYLLCERYAQEIGDATLTPADAQHLLNVIRGNVPLNTLTSQNFSHYLQAERILQSIRWDHIDAALDFLQTWLLLSGPTYNVLSTIENAIGDDDVAWQMCDDWKTVLSLLEAFAIPDNRIRLQPDCTPTDNAYTGIVFEVRAEDNSLLASGGRHNELIRPAGSAQTIPAVGFIYNIESIERQQTNESPGACNINLIFSRNTNTAAVRWAQALRQRMFTVTLVNMVNLKERISLFVQDDGSVQLGQQIYSIEQLDLLLITLEGLIEHDTQ